MAITISGTQPSHNILDCISYLICYTHWTLYNFGQYYVESNSVISYPYFWFNQYIYIYMSPKIHYTIYRNVTCGKCKKFFWASKKILLSKHNMLWWYAATGCSYWVWHWIIISHPNPLRHLNNWHWKVIESGWKLLTWLITITPRYCLCSSSMLQVLTCGTRSSLESVPCSLSIPCLAPVVQNVVTSLRIVVDKISGRVAPLGIL